MANVTALASGSVTFDSTGRGAVSIGPDRANTWWKVTRLVTSTSDGTGAKLFVYRTYESPGTLLDSTRVGAGDTSETDFMVLPGETLLAVYSEGTTGTTGTLVVYGELAGRV